MNGVETVAEVLGLDHEVLVGYVDTVVKNSESLVEALKDIENNEMLNNPARMYSHFVLGYMMGLAERIEEEIEKEEE